MDSSGHLGNHVLLTYSCPLGIIGIHYTLARQGQARSYVTPKTNKWTNVLTSKFRIYESGSLVKDKLNILTGNTSLFMSLTDSLPVNRMASTGLWDVSAEGITSADFSLSENNLKVSQIISSHDLAELVLAQVDNTPRAHLNLHSNVYHGGPSSRLTKSSLETCTFNRMAGPSQ